MNKEQFNKWQEYMNEQAFVVPVQYHYSVVPVSTKVKGMTLSPATKER
ncbi:hypothetical protein [Ligilactobacillus hayakitensis]|nr:hypothetical protein [Ligilactobacillus hayakitensis]